MKRYSSRIVLAFLVAFVASVDLSSTDADAQAGQTIVAPAYQITYGVQGNIVFLRNLNQFNSTWLGCCYNYWFDLTTPGGQAAFSTFMSYRLSGQSISLYMATPTTAGPISLVGSF